MRPLIVHADWSKHPAKRWMSVIRPDTDGWAASAPETVGDPATLFARLLARAGGGAVAFGIDCPMGLPRAYAALHAREADFPAFLRALPGRRGFTDVAGVLGEVSAARPFYPARGVAGMTRQSHALALGLEGAWELSRACDRATAARPAGAPVFWTLGANQSGKAAIAAWTELIVPALLGTAPPRLWPFEGAFVPLLEAGGVVVAETYPAEAMRQLGIFLRGSKRRQADRAACAADLRRVASEMDVRLDGRLAAAIADGFGADGAGEDRIDSLFGALCVLSVATGTRTGAAPDDPWITRWEGWVLGQHPPVNARLLASPPCPAGSSTGGT